jgi:archaellin
MLGHTWYIQYMLNQLYALGKTKVDLTDVETIISDTLEEENVTYKTYCELISKGKLKLLRSIAKEQKVTAPFENGFMQRNGYSSQSISKFFHFFPKNSFSFQKNHVLLHCVSIKAFILLIFK